MFDALSIRRDLQRSGGRGTTPRLIVKVEPEYTGETRAAKVQGTALVGAEVWPDGQVHNLRVKKSLDPGLDASAIEAIQRWRFEPGEKHGRPVKVKKDRRGPL